MAKKQKTQEVEVPVVETPVVKTQKPTKPKWEIKDRTFYLKGGKRPLSYMLRSAGVYYFDEEKGYEREIKNTSNQRTSFVDEMVGDQRAEAIIFRNGVLYVPTSTTKATLLISPSQR